MLMRVFVVLFALFVVFRGEAFAIPGDYDGDGRADIALIDADEPEDKTTVFVRRSDDGSVVPFVFFPFGDFVVSGQYFGDGKTYPGIVSIPSTQQVLRWHIRNPQGGDVVLRYGLKGDVVPNQGDLDCDGITDFAVVRDGTVQFYPGFRLWYVALSGSPGAVIETVFGMQGDQVYIGDTTGDGCAEMIALRGNFTWFSKTLFGSEITAVQWGLPGDIPLLPRDMNGDSLPDYMIARPLGGSQSLYTRFSSDNAGITALGGSSSVPLLGRFSDSSSVAWVERSAGRVTFLRSSGSASVTFGNARRGVVRPDGTVVTEEESGRFTPQAAPVPAASQIVQCNGEISRRDGPGGFKNNPENSKNTLKIMLPSSFTGKVDAIFAYSGGDRVDTLRLGGFEWGNRERYYGRMSLASYPDDLLIAVRLKDGRHFCVTLPDPEKVYD